MQPADAASVKAYLDRAINAHSTHLTRVDVVEFGEDGEPVRVYARKPTIADLSAIARDSRSDTGRDDPFEQALRTVIRLARDENGDKLFTLEHMQRLRTSVDADVLESLATHLRMGVSFEAAKKNSKTTHSSGPSTD